MSACLCVCSQNVDIQTESQVRRSDGTAAVVVEGGCTCVSVTLVCFQSLALIFCNKVHLLWFRKHDAQLYFSQPCCLGALDRAANA